MLFEGISVSRSFCAGRHCAVRLVASFVRASGLVIGSYCFFLSFYSVVVPTFCFVLFCFVLFCFHRVSRLWSDLLWSALEVVIRRVPIIIRSKIHVFFSLEDSETWTTSSPQMLSQPSTRHGKPGIRRWWCRSRCRYWWWSISFSVRRKTTQKKDTKRKTRTSQSELFTPDTAPKKNTEDSRTNKKTLHAARNPELVGHERAHPHTIRWVSFSS